MDIIKWSLIATIICSQHLVSASTAEEPCDVYDKDFQCEPSAQNRYFYAEDPEPDCGADLVQTTIRLFEEGDAVINKQLEEFGNSTEAVLMIGKTGTGKSTLTFFLAGNNSAMISYQTGIRKYSIKDCNGKIGGSGIISQTTFPELVTDSTTHTSFYDYPGFFDTRAVCIEIANAYYMLKVARKIPKAKFILVVDHPSVGGRARDDLVGLLKSIINFIPNIEKFRSNIGLVATKVTDPLADDVEFIPWIKDFLAETMHDLPAVLQGDELQKATFIMETLLINGRIGVFRTPDDCGPLDTILLMQKNKRNLYDMISNNLSYAETEENDFGMSLSKDALLTITQLRASIATDVVRAFQQLTNEVLNTIEIQFECQASTNCEVPIQNLQALYNNQYYDDGYSNESLYRNMSTTDILTNVSTVFLELLNTETAQNFSDSLMAIGGYLDFLQGFDNIQTDILPLLAPLKQVKPEITRLIQSNVKDYVSLILVSSMNGTCLRVFDNAINKFNLFTDIYEKELEISTYLTFVTEITTLLRYELQGNVDIDYFTAGAVNTLLQLGAHNCDEGIKAIRAQKPVLDLLKQAEVDTTIKLSEHIYWLSPFTLLSSLIENEQTWCNFLINLLIDLSEKTYQVDDKGYKAWWTLNHPIPLLLDKEKVTTFWSTFSAMPAVKGLKISKALEILQNDFASKLVSLNILLDTTLLSNMTCENSADVCDCRGIYVSLEEVSNNCKLKSKQWFIYAYHTLYFDTTITGTNINYETNLDIFVVAPFTWSHKMYSINLNGAPGASQNPISEEGIEEGNAGLPGWNAGNLYALVETLGVNVSVNGGKGGKGQQGQKGITGEKGGSKKVTETGAWIPSSQCSAYSGGGVELSDYFNPMSCGPNMNVKCHANANAEIYVYGLEGYPGQRGANGGKGGLGGLGGQIYQPLLTSNCSSNITVHQQNVKPSKMFEWFERSVIVGNDGVLGDIGSGGPGGDGGYKGDTYIVKIDDVYCWSCVEKRCEFKGSRLEPVEERAEPGSKGDDGRSSKSQLQPSPQTFNPVAVTASIISNFMSSSDFLKSNEFFRSQIIAFNCKLDGVRNSH